MPKEKQVNKSPHPLTPESENKPFLWVGIGFRKGVSCQLLEKAIEKVFNEYHLPQEAIAGLATIDLKKNEAGLLELSQTYQLPLQFFGCDLLGSISIPNPSPIVDRKIAISSVAEAAALLAVTSPFLLVPKQIYQQEGELGAVTIAVSCSSQR